MKKFQKTEYLLVFILLSGLIACAATNITSKEVKHYSEIKQETLDALHVSQSMGEYIELKAVPSLSASQHYTIGSVFVADKYPLRYSKACELTKAEIGEPVALGPLPALSAKRTFDSSLGIPKLLSSALGEVIGLDIKAHNIREVSFSYTPGSVLSLPDVKTLETRLKTLDCMRDIANKNILVITQVYYLKERYKSIAQIGNAAIDIKVKDIGEMKIKYTDQGIVEVEDSEFIPRVWALVPYRLSIELDPNLPPQIALENKYVEEFGGVVNSPEISIEKPSYFVNLPIEID